MNSLIFSRLEELAILNKNDPNYDSYISQLENNINSAYIVKLKSEAFP